MLGGNVWGFLYTCNFLITEKQKYEIKQNLPLWISISQVYYKQIFKCSNPPLVGHIACLLEDLTNFFLLSIIIDLDFCKNSPSLI